MIATLITFLAVCFSWVFFRATDLITANEILKGLIGAFGIGIPNAIGIQLGNVKSIFEQIGIEFYLGGGARFVETWIWVTVSALITFLLPNTQEIMRKFEPALDFDSSQESTSLIKETWMPNRAWAVTLGTVSILCLLSLNKPSDFLYFQF
jgi:hypothetical protein